jgi:glutamyl-tRNA reductase
MRSWTPATGTVTVAMPPECGGAPVHGLIVVGVNHRTSPPALRDRFGALEHESEGALEWLRAAGLGEGILVATCDRIELWSHGDRGGALFPAFVAVHTGITEDAVAAALYRHEGEAALEHLFAVASSLDSAVVGEPHVLGQLRAAERAAAAHGLVGPALRREFVAAYGCARRVRRDTRIAERPVSLATAALALARDIHGDLGRAACLLLGPSEMGELMAEQFRRAGVRRLVVCGPEASAARASLRLECHVAPLDELADALAGAGIVIAALGTGRTVLTPALMEATLRRRPLTPIFVIDAASPGDADPAIDALDGVFRYDLADLERVALAGRANRAAAAPEAWRIVGDEVGAFAADGAARRIVPAVVALRRHFEQVRAAVMAESGHDADAATRLLVNRLLHDPSEALRVLAAGDAAELEALLRRLFRLDGAEDEA